MIKAIIFDWGGVVASDPAWTFCKKMSKKLDRNYNDVLDKVMKILIPYSINKISRKKCWRNIKRELNTDLSEEDLERIFITGLKINKRAVKHIKKLRNNYKVGLLSNTEKYNFEKWRKIYLKNLFDSIVTSYGVGVRKPNSKIYKEILNNLKVSATETVFVDNENKNIEGAKKIGMKTILFKGTDQLKRDLKKYL